MKLIKMIILAVLFIGHSLIFAEYPNHVDDYVNDFASVMSSSSKKHVTKLFEKLEKQTGIEAVVVTIDSMSDYTYSTISIEEFATNLFNKWGVGHKQTNNGFMILVAVKDRKCRIELGGAYGRRYDSVMKEVIDDDMLPYFKVNSYDVGILQGAQGVIEKVTVDISWFEYHKWHLLMGVMIIVCIFAGVSCMKNGNTGWGWVFFTTALTILMVLLKSSARGRSSSGFGGGSSFGGGASGSW